MMGYKIMICKLYKKKEFLPNCKCHCDNCLDWLKKTTINLNQNSRSSGGIFKVEHPESESVFANESVYSFLIMNN